MVTRSSVFIIAEAGVNHNGDLELAKKLIDVATEAGVDAVKFQSFKAESLVIKSADKANYQHRTTKKSESQYEMIKKLELDRVGHEKLKEYCDKRGMVFLSSPFDLDSIDMLVELGVPLFKIPSGEITNLPYLRKIASKKKPVILSTGMANLEEIQGAVEVLKNGGVSDDQLSILHCNTDYPTLPQDVNLYALETIAINFPGIDVGYSDHTLGIEIPVAAVAMGARIIEKHFTIDRGLAGPDHKASLEPKELKAMVLSIRKIEKALGNGIKQPSASEMKNRSIVRKSIVAAVSIKKGEEFTEKNITVKRPGTGINPMRWDSIIGKKAQKNYQKEDLI